MGKSVYIPNRVNLMADFGDMGNEYMVNIAYMNIDDLLPYNFVYMD
jgi:hypothetical protein